MNSTIARSLTGALLAAVLGYSGMALAQNSPGGPDDKGGTVNNVPGSTGKPGTFNSKSNSASSSAAQDHAGSTPSDANASKARAGSAPAGNSGR